MKKSVRPLSCLAALAAMLTVGAATTARSEPAYKASDVVKHFAAAKKEHLGGTRALCIGTESECAGGDQSRSKAAEGFNLRVNFDYNSANITTTARSNLDEFARALNDPVLADEVFLVEGHTDGMGSDAFNLDLSMRRARAVAEFLEAHGVSAKRIEAKGYGKQKPLVQDPLASQNRRVEAHLKSE